MVRRNVAGHSKACADVYVFFVFSYSSIIDASTRRCLTGGSDPQRFCHGGGGFMRAPALQLRADGVDSFVGGELGAGQLPREDQG